MKNGDCLFSRDTQEFEVESESKPAVQRHRLKKVSDHRMYFMMLMLTDTDHMRFVITDTDHMKMMITDTELLGLMITDTDISRSPTP